MPLAALAAIGVAGSIGGAAISSHAAGKAADTQSAAADRAAELQYKASQDALNFQKQQYAQQQQNLAPWLQSGTGALTNLDYLLGITPQSPAGYSSPYSNPVPAGGGSAPGTGTLTPPASGIYNGGRPPVQPGLGGVRAMGVPATGSSAGITGINPSTGQVVKGGPVQAGATPQPNTSLGAFGSLMQPFSEKFTAPTNLTEQNDPGFQARLKLGTQAMQQSAAARGSVLTGGTLQALNQLGQDYASNEYGNVYNRAYNEYANRYNQYQQNQTNQYNRLASLAGVGQQTAGQLGMLGQNAANSVSNNLLGTASQIGQQYNNAAAANASGIVGGANAWSGALGNAGNNISQYLLLNQLYGNKGASGGSQQISDYNGWWA